MFCLGFDSIEYPGDDKWESLKTCGIAFTGLYLAPSPSNTNTSWMKKAPILSEWPGPGACPIYVGQQSCSEPGSHILTASQGMTDADDATMLAKAAGMKGTYIIYLDIKGSGPIDYDQLEYISAWITRMRPCVATCQSAIGRSHTFQPGIRCSPETAGQVTDVVKGVPVWAVRDVNVTATVDPSEQDPEAHKPKNSGYPAAVAWQYCQGVTMQWNGDPDADPPKAAWSHTPVSMSSAFTLPSIPYVEVPFVFSVIPPVAPPGATVTVYGMGLGNTAYPVTVTFGGIKAATNYTSSSIEMIQAVVPSGRVGTVDIVTTNFLGNGSQPVPFIVT